MHVLYASMIDANYRITRCANGCLLETSGLQSSSVMRGGAGLHMSGALDAGKVMQSLNVWTAMTTACTV